MQPVVRLHLRVMARKRRDLAGGIFHVMCHSVWTSELFRDDLDRMEYLRELAAAVHGYGWTCLEYCLMTNHLHLILEVIDGSLPPGMQQLNTRYACRFNHRHALRGHVFGGRYGSNRIATDAHLAIAFAYVAVNPVEAGLCQQPEDWPWSSYAAAIRLATPQSFVNPNRVLQLFGTTRELAIARLKAFVEKS